MPALAGTEGFLGAFATNIQSMFDIFLIVVTAVITFASTFGLLYLLREKFFSFNIPVVLRCEVGDAVINKKDRMRVLRRGDRYEAQFQKHNQVMAEVPRDDYSFFIAGGMFTPTKKCFEAFVRDNQATWVYPKPVVGMLEEERVYMDDSGKSVKKLFRLPSFITMPSNLIRYYIDRTRKNIELNTKLKWWQNPQILAFGMMGIFLVGVLFLFLMNKSTAEIALEAVRMGGRVMEQATGQVIP